MSVSTCSFYCGLGYLIREKPLPLQISFSPLSKLIFFSFISWYLHFGVLASRRKVRGSWVSSLCSWTWCIFRKWGGYPEGRAETRKVHLLLFWSSAVTAAAPGVNTWALFPPVHLREAGDGSRVGAIEGCCSSRGKALCKAGRQWWAAFPVDHDRILMGYSCFLFTLPPDPFWYRILNKLPNLWKCKMLLQSKIQSSWWQMTATDGQLNPCFSAAFG